jgi:hypothetical protein
MARQPDTTSTLHLSDEALVVFIDETGVEDFSDPSFPIFGRGGVAFVGNRYRTVRKAWRKLKREYLGGANKPFHAADFARSNPTLRQILAINRFVSGRFHRFAVMANRTTSLPDDIDGHRAVSLMVRNFVVNLVAQQKVNSLELVFESSERGDTLVERDFQFPEGALVNSSGRVIDFNGYFIPKVAMEPGVEIADLIAHTAGRQERKRRAGEEAFAPDFQQVFQRIEDAGLVQYRSIEKIEGEGGGRTATSLG